MFMPTYEYHCNKCGDNFEVEQRMTDDALTTHEICGGELVKVFSSAGIVLKGSGFYKTDNKTKSSSTTKKPETPAKSDTSTSKSSSKESK
ncbi:MAG: FmdB family zinc ribbon protein [Acidimicrobiia bacterium]